MIKLLLFTALLTTTSSFANAAPVKAPSNSDCFESTSWALSWIGSEKDDETLQNVRNVSYFYLGRLTQQDPKADWLEIARKRLLNQRKDESVYSENLKKCTSNMNNLLHIKPD